jgi:carboxypeptidase Q
MSKPRNFSRAVNLLLFFPFCLMLITTLLHAEERGPSTPEERAKVIDLTHKLENDPLNPQAEEWRVWLAKWIDEVPDVIVPVCPGLLPQLLRSNRNYAHELAMQVVYSSAAFIVEHPEQQVDQQAVFQAGDGALKAYQSILKARPRARWYFLDSLIQMRDKGELKEYLRKQIDDNCMSGLPA